MRIVEALDTSAVPGGRTEILLKTGGRLVRHAGRLVFQLAEVLVSREMLGGILERIGRLRLAPG